MSLKIERENNGKNKFFKEEMKGDHFVLGEKLRVKNCI